MFDTERRAKPILKWAGGKSSLLSTISQHIPMRGKRFIEPFLGGASVFLALKAGTSAVINDLNEDLVQMYETVRSSPTKLMSELDVLAAQYSEEFFLKLRASEPTSKLKRAARLIFLNKTCFNGLYRTNSSGKFNVSFGKRPVCPGLYERDNLIEVSKRLQFATLLSEDFETIIDQAKSGDVVYCDPPYVPLSQTSYFSSYTPNGFCWEDHKRLKAACDRAVRKGATVLVSNSAASEVKKLYSDWNISLVMVPRFINSKGDRRGEIQEVLAVQKPRRQTLEKIKELPSI